MDYDNMKYRDLQKKAKEFGIKANQPKAQLINALKAKESENQASNLDLTFDVSPTKSCNYTNEKKNSSVVKKSKNQASNLELSVVSPNKSCNYTNKKKNSLVVKKSKNPASNLELTVDVSPNKSCNYTNEKNKNIPVFKNQVEPVDRFVEFSNEGIMDSPLRKPKTETKLSSLSNKKKFKEAGRTPSSICKAKNTIKTSKFSVKSAKKTIEKQSVVDKNVSHIPKFVSRRVPNFAKIHAQEFEKMDSLDVYLTKKKDRTESIRKPSTAKKIDIKEAKKGVKKLSFGALDSLTKQPTRRSPRNLCVSKPKEATPSKFAPPNLAVDTKKFQFGKVKPTAGKFVFTASPKVAPSTPKQSILHNITNGHKNTPKSDKKNFNLKESLSRPLSYKPHKGKLSNWDRTEAKTVKVPSKSINHKEKAKQIIKGVRLNKRAELMMQRRNLI